ncbi:MAG: hypothetical protein WAM46_01105 [Flavobacterium sp.]
MFEQLTQLVQQYGNSAVVKNDAVPNEQNEAVISETSNSIFAGLQKIASEGGGDNLPACLVVNHLLIVLILLYSKLHNSCPVLLVKNSD